MTKPAALTLQDLRRGLRDLIAFVDAGPPPDVAAALELWITRYAEEIRAREKQVFSIEEARRLAG